EFGNLVHEVFPAVYDTFTEGMTRAQKIRNLLEWCGKHVKMDDLVAEISTRNPEMYEKYKGSFLKAIPPHKE
ncbi:MAG: hypothetical protein HQ559_04640, partial [Lentisphaerae bacterium]|nr:hypothetical protein [Lentisphaerota bacterium]